MKRVLFAAAATALLSMPAGAAEAPKDACHEHGVANVTLGGKPYTVTAISEGPDCSKAVILLTIRTGEGFAIYNDVMATDGIHFVDVDAAKPETMAAALAKLVDQGPNTEMEGTGSLPEWKAGQEAPEMKGEFPFYPDRDMNQDWYMELRAKNLPMVCYVPGLESLHCVSIDPETDAAIKMGAQAFPG
jgi:hypothetical protein